MSLYGDYIKERKNYEIIEDDRGFITFGHFEIEGRPALYIEELYVKPEFRKQNVASEYAMHVERMAKELGIGRVIGSVSPTCNGAHESLLVLLAYGFKLLSCTEDLIYFVKEVK